MSSNNQYWKSIDEREDAQREAIEKLFESEPLGPESFRRDLDPDRFDRRYIRPKQFPPLDPVDRSFSRGRDGHWDVWTDKTPNPSNFF